MTPLQLFLSNEVNVTLFRALINQGIQPYLSENTLMNKIFAVAVAAFFSVGIASAQTSAPAAATAKPAATAGAASNCEAQAIDKNGKPLSGAAKTSSIKKCEGSNKSNAAAACATKAVGKDGKPLAGAAKTSFMKKCEADAGK
jgi:hypothetical protein